MSFQFSSSLAEIDFPKLSLLCTYLKKIGYMFIVFLSSAVVSAAVAADGIIAEEISMADATASKPQWISAIAEQYDVTEDQLQALKAKGFDGPQLAALAQMAKLSKKSVAEVAEAKGSQGWDELAKSLKLEPRDISQQLASLRSSVNSDIMRAKLMGSKDKKKKDLSTSKPWLRN